MIQQAVQSDSRSSGVSEPRQTVWGLQSREVHDAYWNSLGVQCIRLGDAADTIDPHAEFYLLLDHTQLVLFNLRKIVERLIWQAPVVTRLRIVRESDTSYEERIVVDDRHCIKRIERRYSPEHESSHRVFLTSRASVARKWAAGSSSREAWKKIRLSTPRSKVNTLRVTGGLTIVDGVAGDESFFHAIVERWPDPGRVIEGIREVHDGIWRLKDDDRELRATLAGPAWLGHGQGCDEDECIIGPAYCPDVIGDDGKRPKARVRSIFDIEMADPPQRVRPQRESTNLYPAAKRAFDIVVSAAVLMFLSPLLVLIGLAVWIDSGRPILFSQTRQARGGKDFACLKFRTMHRNAEAMLAELAQLNACDGPQVYVKDDPRVTRVGHFLRKSHMDELPQFWNVLVGQMSIVGPRPSPDAENQCCPAWRETRLSVRPGITGLWQVKRTRSDGEDFQEWIRYDIEYVRKASFWFDLKICFQTLRLILLGR